MRLFCNGLCMPDIAGTTYIYTAQLQVPEYFFAGGVGERGKILAARMMSA